MDTKTSICCLPALCCSWSVFKQENLLNCQVSTTHFFGREPHILASWEADCTPSGPNWWTNTWREYFPSARERGQNTELKKLFWGWSDSGAAVGKARHCSALEKPGISWNWDPHQVKNSSITHRLALWVEEAGDYSFTNPSQDNFWEPACSRRPTSLRKPGFKYPELSPHKA
jgi:hypothetical protein